MAGESAFAAPRSRRGEPDPTVTVRSGSPPAVRKLVLFDIDGTLVSSAGAGRAAITRALLEESGATGPIEGYRFDGKTDPQIVHELLAAAGHPSASDERHVAAVCRRYVELLESELDRKRHDVRLYPGVLDLISALEARGDAVIGLLTGNVVRGAELKLAAAGLAPARFVIGAYGSDSADRAALPAIAADRARAHMGRVPSGDEMVIVGDTPADMTCGRGVAARAIGVATGRHSVDELLAAGGYAAFESLADLPRVLTAVFA
jgi:phosphoglycolate phosphatase-like HAD superfamily hydrolase